MKVLIVEDEPLAQEELQRVILKHFPNTDIIGITESVRESVDWLNSNQADLIFMDVHLSDGICFDIFNEIEVKTPIIFTTAYDQYAIKAFQVNGIGYLLKPIVEKDLIAAVNKLNISLYSPLNIEQLLQTINSTKDYKSRIAIKTGDRFSYINISDVAYFYAEDRITFMVPKDGRKKIIDYTIEAIEPMLNPKIFFKITRGCIASIESIDSISKYFNSRLKITLKPEFEGELLISRVRVPDFLKWLDGE